MMDLDRFDKYYTGARSAIDVAIWHIQQLRHGAASVDIETLTKQAEYSICSADTILQLLNGMCTPDDDDDEDGEEELDEECED